MLNAGKLFILLGIVLFLIGIILTAAPKIPFLGKLPGDIHIKKENYELYIPIVTSLLLSLAATGLLWLIRFFGKR